MNKKKALLSAAGLAMTAGVLAAPAAGAAHEGQLRNVYTAELTPVNAPGASATVTIEVFGQDKAVIDIAATGMTPDGSPHAQHIHTLAEGESSCPTVAGADADGDGIVSTAEGAPFYGGVVTSLTTEGDTSPSSALAVDRYPAGTDGAYEYMRAPVALGQSVATDLGRAVVVLHGVDFDDSGAYDGEARSSLSEDLPLEATAPAVCGALTLTEVRIPAPYGGTSGVEGQVTRYYATLLNRSPDGPGFAHWVDAAETGSNADVIFGLADSPEFQARFGDLLGADDGTFVDFAYVSTFGRIADDAGRAHWIGALEDGFDRLKLLGLFADSDEFKALTSTS